MPRARRQPEPHAAWLASLHPALRLLAQWEGWADVAGGTVVVACSGGRDSVALAHAAWALLKGKHAEQFAACIAAGIGTEFDPPELVLWHFDHGLRDDSQLDAEFVQGMGAQLDVQVIVDQGRLTEHPEFGKRNTAALARDARFDQLWLLVDGPGFRDYRLSVPEAYLKLTQPIQGMLAHHLQDQAETVMLNMARGAGLSGIAGMSAQVRYSQEIARPWVRLEPAVIAEYCSGNELAWREDPTNQDSSRSRAVIRHRVLPEIRRINPRAVAHIAESSWEIQELLAWLDEASYTYANSYCRYYPSIHQLPIINNPPNSYKFITYPDLPNDKALAWFTFSKRLRSLVTGLTRKNLEEIRAWLICQGIVCRTGRVELRRYNRIIAVVDPDNELYSPIPMQFPVKLPLKRVGTDHFSSREIQLKRFAQPADLGQLLARKSYTISDWGRHLQVELDGLAASQRCYERGVRSYGSVFPCHVYRCFLPPTAKTPFVLRARRQGERLELPRRAGAAAASHKLLSDIFIDARIPRCFRDLWMVLADADDKVLWVPGLANTNTMQQSAEEGVAWQVRIVPDFDLMTNPRRVRLLQKKRSPAGISQ